MFYVIVLHRESIREKFSLQRALFHYLNLRSVVQIFVIDHIGEFILLFPVPRLSPFIFRINSLRNESHLSCIRFCWFLVFHTVNLQSTGGLWYG